MKKSLFVSALFSFTSILLIAPTVLAAKPGSATVKTPLGIDISWPQCGKQVPTDQAFGIVGVNGGLATTTNDCLKDQLVWAKQSLGGTSQENLQLYVNTANPGGLNTSSWPKNNIDPTGNTTSNPYGSCSGSDSWACAWQYGWNRSLEDVKDRFQPAAFQANLSPIASTYVWWLDVETENTWKLSGSSYDHKSNIAVLEGMTEYLKTLGVRVGLYSTGAQWGQIVGSSVSSTSNLNGLPNWRPGGATLATARDACKAAPLTANGSVALTQFISKSIDYNYACI
jgi:hypothetical protein